MGRQRKIAPRQTQMYMEEGSMLSLYMAELKRMPVFPRGPEGYRMEAEMARRMRQGDAAARQQFIQYNLRFAITCAQAYTGLGLPLEDLIQAANIGLCQAADTFDPDFIPEAERRLAYMPFPNHAVWRIRVCIREALSRDTREIRIPDKVVQSLMPKYKDIEERFVAEHGIGITASDVVACFAQRAMEGYKSYTPITYETAQSLIEATRRPARLQTPVGDADEGQQKATLQDSIHGGEEADTALLKAEREQVLETLLLDIPPLEASVLRSFVALDAHSDRCLTKRRKLSMCAEDMGLPVATLEMLLALAVRRVSLKLGRRVVVE